MIQNTYLSLKRHIENFHYGEILKQLKHSNDKYVNISEQK